MVKATHKQQPEIVAFGEAMVEFSQRCAGGTDYLQGYGGDTSNFCIAAARQGANTGFISAVGGDRFGRLLLELWQQENVDTSAVRIDESAHTGVYFVSHGPDGHHFEYLRAGSAASRYAAHDLPLDMLADAKVLHLSGVSLAIGTAACDAAFDAIAHARKHGVQVSFDTNLRLKLWPLARARATMLDVIGQTDICLPSWDDVTALTGLADRDAIVDFLLARGPRIVALKLGSEGAYVATPNHRQRVPAHPVSAIDATGAGDCFGGAFVARLCAGDDPFSAARYANVAAALSTLGFGAVAPIPTRAAVERMLGETREASGLDARI